MAFIHAFATLHHQHQGAETSAMITAIFWACHLASTFGFQRAHFGFFFDNLYAGAAAQGRCASLLNSDIGIVLAVVVRVA